MQYPSFVRAFFSESAKPQEAHCIGIEHEFVAVRPDFSPIDHDLHLVPFFTRIVEECGWSPMREGKWWLGVEHAGSTITVEPGLQVELSLAPLAQLADIAALYDGLLGIVKNAKRDLDFSLLGYGIQPYASLNSMPLLGKKRYIIMDNLFGSHPESTGRYMMRQMAAIQVHIDYTDLDDAARKASMAARLYPVLLPFLSNSGFYEGKNRAESSLRETLWQKVDPQRSGVPPAILRSNYHIEDYIAYAMAVPLYFVVRDGEYLDAGGATFGDFIAHGIRGLEPTALDWQIHLNTLFPLVRFNKNSLEIRYGDSAAPAIAMAFAAFCKGAYAPAGMARISDYLGQFDERTLQSLIRDVPVVGPTLQHGDFRWAEAARSVIEAAHNALPLHERVWLMPFWEMLETGKTLSDVHQQVFATAKSPSDLPASLLIV